jgi:indole-3-glycerol-phosphate lyase
VATVREVAAVARAAPAPAGQPATTAPSKLAGAGGRCLPVSQTMFRLKAQGKVCTSAVLPYVALACVYGLTDSDLDLWCAP